jgi:hypothetical protein
MRPKAVTVAAAMASVLAGSPTSVATNRAPSPQVVGDRSAGHVVHSAMTTRAPSAWRARA